MDVEQISTPETGARVLRARRRHIGNNRVKPYDTMDRPSKRRLSGAPTNENMNKGFFGTVKSMWSSIWPEWMKSKTNGNQNNHDEQPLRHSLDHISDSVTPSPVQRMTPMQDPSSLAQPKENELMTIVQKVSREGISEEEYNKLNEMLRNSIKPQQTPAPIQPTQLSPINTLPPLKVHHTHTNGPIPLKPTAVHTTRMRQPPHYSSTSTPQHLVGGILDKSSLRRQMVRARTIDTDRFPGSAFGTPRVANPQRVSTPFPSYLHQGEYQYMAPPDYEQPGYYPPEDYKTVSTTSRKRVRVRSPPRTEGVDYGLSSLTLRATKRRRGEEGIIPHSPATKQIPSSLNTAQKILHQIQHLEAPKESLFPEYESTAPRKPKRKRKKIVKKKKTIPSEPLETPATDLIRKKKKKKISPRSKEQGGTYSTPKRKNKEGTRRYQSCFF